MNDMNTSQDRLTGARVRDAVLACLFLLAAIVYCAYTATVHSPRGSTPVEFLINMLLAGLSVGFAVSGLRCSRKWASAVSAIVLGIALIHLLAPRVTMMPVEMLYDLFK
jgi:hypothetical protein